MPSRRPTTDPRDATSRSDLTERARRKPADSSDARGAARQASKGQRASGAGHQSRSEKKPSRRTSDDNR